MAAKKKARVKAVRSGKKSAASKAKGKAARKAGSSQRGKTAPKKPAARGAVRAAQVPNPWKAWADRFEREAATTLRVMRGFPSDQGAFQPHPRSSSAHRLIATFVGEQGILLGAIRGTLQMPLSFPSPPATIDECIAAFEGAVKEVLAEARSARPESHSRTVPFFGGPQQVVRIPAGALANVLLADQIHHRGQLSVYNRMAGGTVPSIYGPSADEPW